MHIRTLDLSHCFDILSSSSPSRASSLKSSHLVLPSTSSRHSLRRRVYSSLVHLLLSLTPLVLLSRSLSFSSVCTVLSVPSNRRACRRLHPQAILLSVLKSLVTSLSSWGATSWGETPPYPAAGVSGNVCRASNAATDQPPTASKANPRDGTATVTSVWLLRSARRALGVLPGSAAEMLWGSLERLCEEYEAPERSHRAPTDLGVGDGCGWLYAAWLSAGPGVQ